jgi:hypothetical protein
MKELHRVAVLENANNPASAMNTLILRNYNDGRHGGWDNYCCYKGQNKGHFVKPKPMESDPVKQKLE